MNYDDLVRTKSRLVLELELAKTTGHRPTITRLAECVADLEGEIAQQLLSEKRTEDAVINLVSRGSCLVDAGQLDSAREAFELALSTTTREKTRVAIRDQLSRLQGFSEDDNQSGDGGMAPHPEQERTAS